MNIKVKILIFCLVLFFVSCIRYDKLQFYINGFVPTTSCVRTDGYYLTHVIEIHPVSETSVDTFTYLLPIFFYDDGSFLYTALYPDTVAIEESTKNYPKIYKSGWGFYQCEGDSVFIEWMYRDDNISKATRIEYNGVFGENNELKMSPDGWGNAHDYNFIPHTTKPDSTLNWLKTHRKYKLDTLSTVSE